MINDGDTDRYDELNKMQKDIENAKENADTLSDSIHGTAQDIERLKQEVEQILQKEGISMPELKEEKDALLSNANDLNWDDIFLLSNDLTFLDSKMKAEIFKKPKLLPSLSDLDYAIVGIAGLVIMNPENKTDKTEKIS